MREFNRDFFNSIPVPRIEHSVMTVADSLQHFSKEEQTMATAILFTTLAEVNGITPQELFAAVKNVTKEGYTRRRAEINAVQEYVKGELT